MKTIPLLIALSLPLVLTSCVSEYTSYESYQEYATPSYYGRPSYSSYRPTYYEPSNYYGSYRNYSRPYYSYSGYGSRSYDCDDHNDHYSHRSSSSSKKKSSDNAIRIVDYNQAERRESLPTGYHSPEWWKSRGYSLGANTYKTRDGDIKGKSKSSSSSKKKKKD